jgi:methionyl-tRNA formyltransferase
MGTPSFAVPSLETLAAEHDVVLVVTQPDRPSGRGTAPSPPAVKIAAARHGLSVSQPQRLDHHARTVIAAAHPDIVCVVAFGMLLPAEILAVPRYGCVNVHASLLPLHRGAAPVQRAILDGDTETGVSIMHMEEGLDTGPYALQVRVPVGDRYATELEDVLARAGADALIEVLALIEAGDVVWTAQDDGAATYAAKITKDDVALLPEASTEEAFRRVRAATHRAPARACVGDRELTVVRARPVAERSEPGTVCVREGWPVLALADGSLLLEVVRPAGRGDMSGADWARGARLTDDVCWRCTRPL